MGNHAYKKKEAKEFNEIRRCRLQQAEKQRLDRINSPEKYQRIRQRRSKVNTFYLMAALTMANKLTISK